MINLKTQLTRFITTLAVVIIVANVSMADVNEREETNKHLASFQKQQVAQILDRAVDYPQQARESDITGLVRAEVRITESGQFEIKAINGHPELATYVKKQLANVQFNDYSLTGKAFIARFDFRN